MPDYATAPATLSAAGKDYSWIGMNYILCDKAGGTVSEITFSTDKKGLGTRTYTSGIPVKRNYRSNLVGSLFTTSAGWNVTVDSSIIDTQTPLEANAAGEFEIWTPADMMKIAKTYSVTPLPGGDKSRPFKLMADINMDGYPWEAVNADFVSLDGNGHTISNLKNSPGSWRGGIFAWAGTIQVYNVTLENFEIYGAQAGLIAGNFEGNTYTKFQNIKIKGTNKVHYNKYSTDSYTEDWGGVGAIFGVQQHTMDDSKVSITIEEGATIDVYKNGMTTACPGFTAYSTTTDASITISGVTKNGTVTVHN